VVLQADPAVALGAATKQYVDAQASASNLPAGAVMAFYRNAAPTGWLECNGQSAAAYPNLVALGIITVPDLRGEFVRGWDNGRGIDPSRALGSTQADMVGPHTHLMNGFTVNLSAGGTSAICDTPSGGGSAITKNTAANAGTETRPRNVALMYCIKT
jgi:phage-related tail fiber protein